MNFIRRNSTRLGASLLILLLTACTSPITAQRPTAAATLSETATATNIDTKTVVTNAPTNTPLVTFTSTTPITATDQNVAPPAQAAPTVAPLATTNQATTVASRVATAGYDNPTSPVDLLASYYDAVNLQEYTRAYGYWETAPLPFDAFAAGYADTASVQVVVQPPTRIEGAAGSLYAEIPTYLIATHHDGSVHSFAGCIVTRKSNLQPPDAPAADNNWHLYQARLSEVSNNVSIPAQLASACAP